MNMNKQMTIAFIALAAIPAAAESEILDGGWRLSAGAVYDSGVKTDFKFMPQQTYVTPYSYTPGAVSREEAEKLAKGKTVGGITYYTAPDGSVSWHSATPEIKGTGGHDPDATIYYQFPKSQWDGERSFTLNQGTYEEITVDLESPSSQERYDSDENAMLGLNLQLSRNLYHDDDNNWGLEVAVAVQYARRNDVVKTGSSWKTGSSTKKTGTYKTTFTDWGELGDALSSETLRDFFWTENDAGDTVVGQYGLNSDDAAIPIDLDGADLAGLETEWGGGEALSDEGFGSLYASGDYDNLEMMLLLQPYYDVCDWFSVNATLGVVCSRQSLDMSLATFQNGQREGGYDRNFDQWDIYGVAGLGVMFYYEGWTLSGDVLARVFDRDLDIEDKHYRGTVSRGDWMVRVGVGYEF